MLAVDVQGLAFPVPGVGTFHTSLGNLFNQGALPRASTFLLTMVLLTVLIDRTSRSLKIRCVGC